MQLTHTLTVLMGSFYFLLSEATTEMTSPKILELTWSQKNAFLGKQLIIDCEADPGFPNDFTLIYWLVNGNFPEMAKTNGRVLETEESASEDGKVLKRSLIFQRVVPEDFKSTFTCVVTSPAGTDRRHMTLIKHHWSRRCI